MNGEHHLLGARAGAARLPETHVPRRRLDDLLGDRARRPVTLVSAPPGSGKTMLVTSALARRPDAVSLIVDRRDDQTGHLARLVVAALVRHGAVSMEVDVGVAPATLLDALFAAVEAARGRAVLVLDDVHELTSADALDTLAYLLEHAPVGLDVVLCSRADPPLRLTRLRLAERLGEIRGGALAFERAEAAELLSAHGVRLTRNQLDALWQRTQGWAAGLQLAACALQGDPDPREVVDSVARTESVIVAYLLEELLNRQDEAAEEFLLRTSVAPRVTPELAEVLTGDTAAGERLAELERHGVFAAEVDGRNWYRYHALFATLLEGHLRHRRRDLADELHRRAAGWFLDRGLLFEAESHARAAGDWTLVDRLATRRWIDRSVAGDDAADSLLAGVPAGAVASRAGLAVLAAADACSRHDRPAADTHRQCADGLAPDPADSDGASPATALLDIAYARAFGADDRAVAAVASLTGRSAGDRSADDRSGGDTAARGLAQLAALRGVGLALDVGDVERAAQAADGLAVAAAGTWIGAEALATLALAEAVSGDVAGSERHIRATVAGYDPGRTSLSQAAALAFAVVHALRGEPQHALDVLATVGDVVPSPDRCGTPARPSPPSIRGTCATRSPMGRSWRWGCSRRSTPTDACGCSAGRSRPTCCGPGSGGGPGTPPGP
jgi:LuxR family transcriptional regulator, maltose regulon positive regulatory protein